MKNVVLVGVVCLLLALVAQPVLATFVTGFEPNEAPPYATGTLVPQNSWVLQFSGPSGINFDVYDYSTASIPWVIAAGGQYTTIPVNPNGGEQFVASGNQGRDMHPATYSGLVEMSVDYAAGPWLDGSGNYNGALTARPGNGLGTYTAKASTAGPGDTAGPWAWNLQAWNAAGTKMTNHSIGYRFNGEAGFDELTMEQWYRMGIVCDMATGRVTQLKSQELIPGGQIWIKNNPQALWDDPADSPDMGPQLYDIYNSSGSAGTYAPDHVGLFNVGNGTLSMFDNLHVGEPYQWEAVPIPEPSTALMLLAGFAFLPIYRRRIK